ncbi:SET domain-containing protein-lysine N-methyltransferase [Candidatus Pacearchaeota archaeon CG_4_9_14_0_2_um_filter_39_13]|nr:SET domain-containing protein [Candidatus Pacearchaeota archaeon]OIO43960.1 MAG: hypothetical protein AUJ64_01005 [Candidatus Pacearchaeota archaeon CG1_02_39_14]PJC44812.1 MAG: SET domain-containing protein-lysine N-methyltransferase [Candidatus Pacearchaeota archaeon CG_4_9_14_0_2_um_filter_39_13]
MKSNLIVIKKSIMHGKGAFAKTEIKEKTRIIEYIGKKVTKKRGDKIYLEQVKKAEKEGIPVTTYLFSVSKKYDIDGDVSWNSAKYINHSCNPNCEVVNEDGHIWIISKEDIKKGEEITYDYGFPLINYKDHKCRCGSESCMGYILSKRSRKWLEKRLTKRK